MDWMSGELEKQYRALLRVYLYRSFGNLSEQEAEYMLEVAYADFLNYIAVERDVIFEEGYEDAVLTILRDMYLNNEMELDKTLSEWFEVWAWKWRQRVKLALKEEEESKLASEVENKVQALLPKVSKLYEWAKRYAIGSLVRHGEVCFTNLLAETVVKEVFFKVASSEEPEKAAKFLSENPAFVISEITKRVKELSAFKGNLVVVRLNPLFFESQRGENV